MRKCCIARNLAELPLPASRRNAARDERFTAVYSSPAHDAESRRVAAAFSHLREDERELLLLAAWEGLDAAALAAVLRCSPNAARIRLHRARRRFAAELAAVDGGPKRHGTGGHALAAVTPIDPFELEDSP